MPETDIGSAVASDLTNAIKDFSVDSATTDAATGVGETRWDNTEFSKYLGYYKKIPELAAAIDAKATWTVGKGYTADAFVTMNLEQIRGFGKDTFNTILENMIRTYHIGGDAFAEIVTDEDGVIINLKPLDPSTITIVANSGGKIIRYEQNAKAKDKATHKFQPDEILHLARNRVADEIHGVSIIPVIEEIILMRNEAMTDWRRVLHRNVEPMLAFHLDTDDTSKISSFKAKTDAARGKGENMYIPKGTVEFEPVTIAPNATLNPLQWIENLNQYFFQATGVPDIIVGGSKQFTEASAKIAYLAFQQTIEEEQLFIEQQIEYQLGLGIELTFPADLTGEALSDKPREEAQVNQPQVAPVEQAGEPNDTTVELEGRK